MHPRKLAQRHAKPYANVMMRSTKLLVAVLLTALSGCSIGKVKPMPVQRDLTGFELLRLQKASSDKGTENQKSIDGQFTGFPLWFAPAVSFRARGSNALYHADYDSLDKSGNIPTSERTGYEYSDMRALGLGIVGYQRDKTQWDTDGDLEYWERDAGWGAGLVYHTHYHGRNENWSGMSVHILGGMFGYSEDNKRRYLKFLWIPIPM